MWYNVLVKGRDSPKSWAPSGGRTVRGSCVSPTIRLTNYLKNNFKKPLDKSKSLCYNRDNKREEPRAMKDKVVMIISICAFIISWGIIILAVVLEAI